MICSARWGGQDEAAKLGVDVSECTVVDPSESPDLPRYVELLVQARKHKVLCSARAPPPQPVIHAYGLV